MHIKQERPTDKPPLYLLAIALLAVMASATLASPLYSLYRAEFNIGSGSVSIIYSAYMVGALLSLIGLAQLSDRLGYVSAIVLALILTLIGLNISALSGGIISLSIGRFLIGLGAGITSSAATVGIIAAFAPARASFASAFAAMLATAGLGIGPMMAGLTAAFFYAPLISIYLIVSIIVFLTLIALLRYCPDVGYFLKGLGKLTPHFYLPLQGDRQCFFLLGGITFIGYAIFSLFASLAPGFLSAMLHMQGPMLEGLGVSLLFIGSFAAQVIFRTLDAYRGVLSGAIVMALSLIILAVTINSASPILFLISDIAGGLGQGMAFMSALRLVSSLSLPEQRGGLMASFFTMAYLGGVLPLLATGLIATLLGTSTAIIFFSFSLGAILFVFIFFFIKLR